MSEGAKIIEDKGWVGSGVEYAIAKVLSKTPGYSTNFNEIHHVGQTKPVHVGRTPGLLRHS